MNLVVGGTGFIGGHLVEFLFRNGEISRATFRKGAYLKLLDKYGVQCIECDLTTHECLHEALRDVDTVYNLASPTPFGGDVEFASFNQLCLRNLLEACSESGIKSFVHLSTIDIYGFANREIDITTTPRPHGDYQLSKLEGERMVLNLSRSSGFNAIIIRATKAIGARDNSLALPLARMVDMGNVIIPKCGNMSFTHPKDIARAMYLAAKSNTSSNVFLIKSFDSSIYEIVNSLSTHLGRKVRIHLENLFRRSGLDSYVKKQINASMLLKEQDNWKEIGFAPEYNLESTIEEIARWYLSIRM